MANDQQQSADAVPGLHHNRLSWSGLLVAIVALANIAFFFVVGFFSRSGNPYFGIFTWVLFPSVLVLGLLLFLGGMLRERRRRRRLGAAGISEYPRLDLNSAATRNKFVVALTAAVLFVLLSAVGSYQAYEVSESVNFCGNTCHTPMHPEFTAYQLSPHARVRCVDCHVGSGAGWYVRAKLNGAHQLYALFRNNYNRPIQTPIRNLRPARETCEQCHWPERYIGGQMKVFTHYSSEPDNKPMQVRMLMKTGGGSASGPVSEGIHWHMNIGVKVTYIATDAQRQKIPWVRLEDRNGRVTEYKLRGATLTDAQIAAAPKRTMDCIDCHSRPSHAYIPPDQSVDLALLGGRIDPSLPNIKTLAVSALTKDYKTTTVALQAIAHDLDEIYRTKYPQAYAQQRPAVDRAIAETQAIFQRTIFPEMKVDWRTHPNNIGHFYSPGCFRCHDGEHVSADGKVVRKDCDICHAVLGQDAAGGSILRTSGVPFRHPQEIGDMKDVTCTDCHSAGSNP